MKAEWTNSDSLTTSQTTKAILVIDMPEHCYECPVVNYKHCNANYFVRRNHGGNIPYNFSNEYIHEQGRQTWCPLKPLPQKKEVNLPNDRVWSKDEIMAYTHGISVGYNECLDDLGETE